MATEGASDEHRRQTGVAAKGDWAEALPSSLHRYFWDYDPKRLSREGSPETIVYRLLEVGGWDAVQWLLGHLSSEELGAYLARRRGRGMAPRRLRFWGVVLDLSRAQVDEWIAEGRSHPWLQRTHR